MKLRQIHETILGHQLSNMMKSVYPGSPSLFFARPSIQDNYIYDSSAGDDSGSRIASSTSQPTGVPIKERHRTYLGMSNKIGIRL